MATNGYVRQASADIQPNLDINSADFNNEYNAIQTAFSASIGHTHDGTAGGGQQIPLATAVTGQLPLANGGTAFNASSIDNLLIHLGVGSTSNTNFNSVTTVAGVTTGTTLAVGSSATIATTLGVTGATTLSSTLHTVGAATLDSNLTVSGTTSLQGMSATTGNYSSTLSVTGATTLSSTLAAGATTVTGALSCSGDFAVATNKFTVASASGNTSVAGILGVTGATTLSSTLAAGNTTITGTLSVSSTMNVSGVATLASGSLIGSDKIDHFPSTTTKMLFYMAAAPTGWTQDTSVNDKVIRVTSGAGAGTGGSWTISGTTITIATHAITTTEMPVHNHGVTDPTHAHTFLNSGSSVNSSTGASGFTGGSIGFDSQTAGASTGISINNAGSGAAHGHAGSTFSNDAAWRPAYYDVIVCAKS